MCYMIMKWVSLGVVSLIEKITKWGSTLFSPEIVLLIIAPDLLCQLRKLPVIRALVIVR